LYVVVLINTYGGEEKAVGHGAIAIQNRATGAWEYYSFYPVEGATWKMAFNLSFRAMLEHHSLDGNEFGKFIKREMYDDFLIFATNPSEEQKMLDYINEIKAKVDNDVWWYRYRIYSNSCIDVVTDTLQEGIKIGDLPSHLVIDGALKPINLIEAIITGISPFRNVTGDLWRTDDVNDIKLDQPPPPEKKVFQ